MTALSTSLHPHDAVDFHLHTLASDGGWEPAQLVDYLIEREYRLAAICDHDTMRSVPEAMERAAGTGLTIIPAVEVTSWWEERQWHLLVYNIDIESPAASEFRALLKIQQDNLTAAAERAAMAVEKQGHKLPSLNEVVNGRPLLPVHVLLTIIKDGHAKDLKTAHELTTKHGEDLRVDTPLEDVVATAHMAGGICSIAHPGRDDLGPVLAAEQLDRMLQTIPIDGLEGHYRTYTDADTVRYRHLAAERNLLVTSGSDSHAPGRPVDPKPYPAQWVVPFIERLGFDVELFEGDAWAPGARDAAQLRRAAQPWGL